MNCKYSISGTVRGIRSTEEKHAVEHLLKDSIDEMFSDKFNTLPKTENISIDFFPAKKESRDMMKVFNILADSRSGDDESVIIIPLKELAETGGYSLKKTTSILEKLELCQYVRFAVRSKHGQKIVEAYLLKDEYADKSVETELNSSLPVSELLLNEIKALQNEGSDEYVLFDVERFSRKSGFSSHIIITALNILAVTKKIKVLDEYIVSCHKEYMLSVPELCINYNQKK